MQVLFDGVDGGTEQREMEIPPREDEIVFLDEELYHVVSVMWHDPAGSDDHDVTVELSDR